MLARTLATTDLLVCLVIAVSIGNLAAGQEKQPDVEPPKALVEVKLPQAELDTDSVAALTKVIEVADEAGQKAELHAQRAKQYMRAQQWNKAAADYRKAAELQPRKSMHWMRGAVLLRLAKNRMHYDQLANEMLKHFQDTTNPYNAERTAKMCWLPVPPVDERELAEKLADLAMADREREWGEYYPSTRALGHYRYQQYDEALKAIAESDRLNAARREKQVDLDTINRIVESMCLAQLGRNKESLAKLKAAGDVLQKNVADVERLYNGNNFWNDWLLATVLHEEARTLIVTRADEAKDLTPKEEYRRHIEQESQHLKSLKEEVTKRQTELESLKVEILQLKTALETGEKTLEVDGLEQSREEVKTTLATKFDRYKKLDYIVSQLDRIHEYRSTQLSAVSDYSQGLSAENEQSGVDALRRLQRILERNDAIESLLLQKEFPDPVKLRILQNPMLEFGSLEFRVE